MVALAFPEEVLQQLLVGNCPMAVFPIGHGGRGPQGLKGPGPPRIWRSPPWDWLELFAHAKRQDLGTSSPLITSHPRTHDNCSTNLHRKGERVASTESGSDLSSGNWIVAQQYIVPRPSTSSNFFPVMSKTRVASSSDQESKTGDVKTQRTVTVVPGSPSTSTVTLRCRHFC